ncbi:MAG: zinc-ribbon domain-containing protein [Clostridia bacterium]|nr:zinc-ribbon domain-containing protein [Clostridia bacterium]
MEIKQSGQYVVIGKSDSYICKECGQLVDKIDVFCRNCGKKLK